MRKKSQINVPIINLNKDDLKELGDRIIQAFKDIQEKRKQQTQKTKYRNSIENRLFVTPDFTF